MKYSMRLRSWPGIHALLAILSIYSAVAFVATGATTPHRVEHRVRRSASLSSPGMSAHTADCITRWPRSTSVAIDYNKYDRCWLRVTELPKIPTIYNAARLVRPLCRQGGGKTVTARQEVLH